MLPPAGAFAGFVGGGLSPAVADSSAGPPPPSSNTVGIIFPPPDLRGIIDKTAQFVAKNGQSFEARVLREPNAQRFAFLHSTNPYNAYYVQKIEEFKTGTEGSIQPSVPQAILDMKNKDEAKKKEKEQLLMLTNSAMTTAEGEEREEEITAPEPDVYSVIPPYIAPVDIDVIKTTAQFVARNGQRFLVGLNQRERNNPQFDFLKPTHALFGYFTNLVEAYTKCLMPPSAGIAKLKCLSKDHLSLLPVCYRRYKWQAEQDNKRNETSKLHEEERAQMQSIDWHDFVVVETIEFTAEDEKSGLAPPVDFSSSSKDSRPALPLEASASRLPEMTAAGVLSGMIEVIKDAEDMEMDEDEEREREAAEAAKEAKEAEEKELALQKEAAAKSRPSGPTATPPPPPSAPPEPDEEIPLPPEGSEAPIVRDYVRPKKKRALDPTRLQKCPITGTLVSADEMSNHLRILLLDPKWKEQKDKFLEKARKESAFAPISDVESNLATFVTRRPDLFGNIEDI